jgi:hypothetical protein
MKTGLNVILGMAGMTLLSGCVVSIGDGGSSRHREEIRKSPPVMIVPSSPSDSVAMAEVDAATKLSVQNNRLDAFRNIASRTSLTPPVQVHLVNTALRALDFETSRVDILKTIISNPAFSLPAREAILRQLELLEFETSRTQILEALQSRPVSG